VINKELHMFFEDMTSQVVEYSVICSSVICRQALSVAWTGTPWTGRDYLKSSRVLDDRLLGHLSMTASCVIRWNMMLVS